MKNLSRHARDPVELLLANILRRGLRGPLLGTAAGLAVGCQSGDPEDRSQANESIGTGHEQGADAAGSGGSNGWGAGDGGRNAPALDAAVVPLDAQLVVDAAGHSEADGAIQIETDGATPGADAGGPGEGGAGPSDAGSDAAQPSALACPPGSHLPVSASGLRPAETFDYLAVREVVGGGGPADGGSDAWTRTDFQTLSESGEKCATATSPGCERQVARHPEPLRPSSCLQLCREWSVVTTRGDLVQRWAPGPELVALLAPIDSFDEALLLVASAGYELTCNDAVRSSIREFDDGYEVYATRITSDCAPIITTRYRLHVGRDGTIRELGSEQLEREENACIGRVPAGLISASVDHKRSALGDYLARAAHLEAASVFAFERLARELFAYGAPPELVERALESAADEVEHARIMAALARAYGGEPVDAEVAALPRRTLEEIAIENAVEGCVRETYGALVGAYQAEHAAEPRLRRAMHRIAADEARHAALAQDVHAWAMRELSDAERERVRAAERRARAELAGECAVSAVDESVRQQAGLPTREVAQWFLSELSAELWDAPVASVA